MKCDTNRKMSDRMQLSISNIAWDKTVDDDVYELMRKYGFTGLEIAPTRIFPDAPYEHRANAAVWAADLKKRYGFVIPSMQSIWYGKTENIFGSEEERFALISYTKKAIDFASAIKCGNLVFGCPKNRNIPDGKTAESAICFFREIVDYAEKMDTVIGLEANPSIFNTNFINNTESALQLVKEIDSPGFKLNLDMGTMIYNQEAIDILKENVHLINHVHISEPGLKPIVVRPIHIELCKLLKEEGYKRFVSIEMGKSDSISELNKILDDMGRIFI